VWLLALVWGSRGSFQTQVYLSALTTPVLAALIALCAALSMAVPGLAYAAPVLALLGLLLWVVAVGTAHHLPYGTALVAVIASPWCCGLPRARCLADLLIGADTSAQMGDRRSACSAPLTTRRVILFIVGRPSAAAPRSGLVLQAKR
jgi:hypothetical protein